jgi:hypothetical protein
MEIYLRRQHFLSALTILLILSMFGLGACEDPGPEPTPAPIIQQPDPDPDPNPDSDGELTIHDNVLVIDSALQTLDLTPALLAEGTYRFTGSGAALEATVGTVIVGSQGGGFLRRVTAATTQGSQTTLQTEQASLDELFSGGLLTFSTSSDSLTEGRLAKSGFKYKLNEGDIHQSGELKMDISGSSISLNPKWDFLIGFGEDGTIEAQIGTKSGSFDANLVLNVKAIQAVTLPNTVKTLKRFSKTTSVKVPVKVLGRTVMIPIPVVMDLEFILEYGASISQSMSREVFYNYSTGFSLGAQYAQGQWNSFREMATPTETLTFGDDNGKADATVNMAIIPKVTFKIFGVAGPFFSLGLQEELKAEVGTPSPDWNFQADAWLRTTLGITGDILGKKLPDYFPTSWDTDKLSYRTPFTLQRTSGDNQTGTAKRALPEPLKVRVLDSNNNPESGVKVYFTPDANNGIAIPSYALTDSDGYAETSWELGSGTNPVQKLVVTAKNADGTPIGGAPLDFVATASDVDKIEIASGNNQLGALEKPLNNPLEVIVKDAENNPLKDVKVEWRVKSGGGIVSSAESLSDSNGVAKVNWTLGNNETEKQEVEAIVKKKDGTLVTGSPALFKAFTILGKWQYKSATERYYDKKGGELLETEEVNYFHQIEFTSDNKVRFYWKGEVSDQGSYSLDIKNGLLSIYDTEADDYTYEYKISDFTPEGFTLKAEGMTGSGGYGTLDIVVTK